MNENIDLKKIEKKAWTSYFQDGLWDILLGLILLNFGIAPLIEDITGITYLLSYNVVLIVAFIIFYSGKKYITTPRLGKVKFSAERKTKQKKTTLVVALSVLFGLIVFAFAATDFLSFKTTIYFGAILFGINAVIVFSVMAFFLDFNRLYVYGWFFALSIVIVEISRPYVSSTFDNIIGFGIFGGIILLIGIAYLIRFIQKYPLQTEETFHGN